MPYKQRAGEITRGTPQPLPAGPRTFGETPAGENAEGEDMAPRCEIALTLSTEEVGALKQALKEVCAGHRTPQEDLLKGVLSKIRMAEEKML